MTPFLQSADAQRVYGNDARGQFALGRILRQQDLLLTDASPDQLPGLADPRGGEPHGDGKNLELLISDAGDEVIELLRIQDSGLAVAFELHFQLSRSARSPRLTPGFP